MKFGTSPKTSEYTFEPIQMWYSTTVDVGAYHTPPAVPPVP